MKKNSLQLKDEKAQLKLRAKEITEKCKVEIRNLNSDEQTELEEIKTKINTINTELRDIENLTNLNSDTNNKQENKTQKKTMEKRFSVLKAIRNIANNKPLDEVSAAVVEQGQAEMRKSGINYVGQIQLPCEERAAVTVTTEGQDVVATDMLELVKPLQAKNVMIAAGAKFVSGLVGDVQFPVMNNCNCTWEGETAAANDGNITFDSVKLSPKRLTCVVPVSKQFILQDSVGAENAIREEIINAINAKLEATILGAGAGSSTEPKGLFPSEGDTHVFAVTDYSKLCELESKAEEANVYGNMTYLVSPKAKAALRGMSKGTKSTQLVFENGEVDGTKAMSTSHLKANHVVYGDMSQYVIANWGNIDLVVDNVTLAANGQIRLVVNAYFDAKPLRANAIQVAKVGA